MNKDENRPAVAICGRPEPVSSFKLIVGQNDPDVKTELACRHFDPHLSVSIDCALRLEEAENDPLWRALLREYRYRLEEGVYLDEQD